MSGSIFETTFRKYTNLVLEGRVYKKIELNDEQNLELKNLYIIISNCLEDICVEARREKINSKNCEQRFPTFLEEYMPKNPYITAYNYETLKIQLPKSIKDCFGDLADELSLKIVSKDKPIMKAGKGVTAVAGLDRDDKTNVIYGIYIRIDCLFGDITEMKAHLQHELQHIHLQGHIDGLKDGKDKLHALIEYLGNDGEIFAYAKEYAYIYHKKYSRDTGLRLDKLKKLFNNQKSEPFNHYMLFGEDADVIRDKYDVTNSDIKKMKKIHDEFVDAVKNSLNYFL